MSNIGNSPGNASQRVVTQKVATAGQTRFASDSGYATGYVDVIVNGIDMVAGSDFNETGDGINIDLVVACEALDDVKIVAWIPRGLSDGYTKPEANAILATKADLVNGTVPSSQLPSYVDDVLEYSAYANFPTTGETGKIYVDKSAVNKAYRWSGSAYILITDLSSFYNKTEIDTLLINGAAGLRTWTPLSISTTPLWVKVCKVVGGQNDRLTLQLSGSASFSATPDDISGGASIYMTMGNNAVVNNLNVTVVNSSSLYPLVTDCYIVKGNTDYIWDLWVKVNPYARIVATAFGNLYMLSTIYGDVVQEAKPTGGYDKKVGRAVTSLTPGAILQVVSAVNTTALGINCSTVTPAVFYDVGTQATITPQSINSKILVLIQQSHFHDAIGAQGTGYRLNRNGTDITLENGFTSSYTGNANRIHGYVSKSFLDSPASVSALTYKVRAAHWSSSGSAYFQYGGTESPSTITLIEVAG
jgi:hypothetical protein